MFFDLKNELIHGFLVRSQLRIGEKRFDNILTKKGGWRKHPYIIPGTSTILAGFADSNLQSALMAVGLPDIQERISSNLKAEYSVLSNFLNGKKSGSPSKYFKPIDFCFECILSGIKTNGYPSFETRWFHSLHCKTHDTSLYRLTSKCMNDSADALRDLFRGALPENVEKLPRNSYVNKFTLDPCEDLDVDYLAPCALEIYKDFVRRRKHTFPVSISKALRMDLRLKTEHYFKDFWLNKIYRLLHKEKVAEFLDFRARAFVQVPIDFSVRKDASIVRTVFKSKEANCQRCKFFDRCDYVPEIWKVETLKPKEHVLSVGSD